MSAFDIVHLILKQSDCRSFAYIFKAWNFKLLPPFIFEKQHYIPILT